MVILIIDLLMDLFKIIKPFIMVFDDREFSDHGDRGHIDCDHDYVMYLNALVSTLQTPAYDRHLSEWLYLPYFLRGVAKFEKELTQFKRHYREDHEVDDVCQSFNHLFCHAYFTSSLCHHYFNFG